MDHFETDGGKGGTLGHKRDVSMGSKVIRKFGRSYQMCIMPGQRSSCCLDTKCETWNSVYFDLGDLYNIYYVK